MVKANSQEQYRSDTTTPGLNDGEKIPAKDKNTQKTYIIHNM